MLVMTACGNFTFNWIFQFWDQICPSFIYKVNELDLLWVPNFIALRMYFIYGTKFSWNEGTDTCQIDLMSNVCSLVVIIIFWWLLGGYCSLPSGYCSILLVTWCLLLGGYWRSLLVTGFYCLLPLVTARSHF